MAGFDSGSDVIDLDNDGDDADLGQDLTDQLLGSDSDDGGGQEGGTQEDAFTSGYKGANKFGAGGDDEDDSNPNDTTAGSGQFDGGGDDDGTSDEQGEQAPPPRKIGKWTEQELEAHFTNLETLRKGHETVAGRVGSLLQQLQGQGRKQVTAAELEGVTAEFGPEFADALARDLNKIGGVGGVTVGALDEAKVAELVDARAEQLIEGRMQQLELRTVRRAHPDCQDWFASQNEKGEWVPGKHNAKYIEWFNTQPAERQQQLATSWDSDVIIPALKEAKAYASRGAGPGNTDDPPQRTRRDIVRSSMTPRSVGGHAAPPATDPFLAGYKTGKSGRGD